MSSAGGNGTRYYFSVKSNALLDRTGGTRLEIERSDLCEVELPSFQPIGRRKELRLDHYVSGPRLSFKPGTKPFVVEYLAMKNALIAEAGWARQIDPRSIGNDRVVTADFPNSSREYLFGNLRFYEVFATHVNFEGSSFFRMQNDHRMIHEKRVGRGEEPFDTLPRKPIEHLQFKDAEQYDKAVGDDLLAWIVPERLCLSLSWLPSIFNFTTHLTLFHEDLALPLRTAKNPGLWFPGPPVRVELG